ncbi:MAG: histidine phosphatase family protein [Candidatus Binatia bacterium]
MKSMTSAHRLYLIRHGRPTAGFSEASDPGLDEVGREQALGIARELRSLGPLAIITSPLKRTRETAFPFEKQWGYSADLEPRVAEIPSPSEDLQARSTWLHTALRGRWNDLPEAYQNWRAQVVSFLTQQLTAAVITTHFVAINAAVGAATGDDRLVCFEPDHCSCTVLEVIENRLQLVSLGQQRATGIL